MAAFKEAGRHGLWRPARQQFMPRRGGYGRRSRPLPPPLLLLFLCYAGIVGSCKDLTLFNDVLNKPRHSKGTAGYSCLARPAQPKTGTERTPTQSSNIVRCTPAKSSAIGVRGTYN